MVDVCETRLLLHLEGRDLRDMDWVTKSDPFAVVYFDAVGPSASVGGTDASSSFASGGGGGVGGGSGGGGGGAPPPAARSSTAGVLSRTATSGRALLRRGASAPARGGGGAPTGGGPPGPLYAAPPAEASQWVRLGATETIKDNLCPQWVTSLELRYYFERTQRLRVEVYDRDGPSTDLARHDFIGWASLTVPELVRSSGQRVELALRNERRCGPGGGVGVAPAAPPRRSASVGSAAAAPPPPSGGGAPTAQRLTGENGFLTIRAEEVSALKQTVRLDFGVARLKKRSFFSSARPHLVLSRALEDGNWLRIHRSEVGVPTATRGEFRFPRHVMSFEKLCRCDEGVPLRADILYERAGAETVAGSVELSLRRLRSVKSVPLTAGGKTTGELLVHGVVVTEEHSFLDYIIGGCEVSLVVAIDFTASNGDPGQPGTLHYRDPARPNEYEAATRAVGDILANYDSDQLFPAFGFGAKLPPDYRTAQHCFSLTGGINPECVGVEGILNSYRQTLYNVRLSGPTVFAEIVRTAANYANTNVTQEDQKYTILLIVTDGVLNDMAATKEAIIHASSLPLSIVIVGVGAADFSDMNLLDGDDQPLGPGTSRDIVQFVPYRQFHEYPEVLASRVLEEIPTQLLAFMKSRGLRPNPPVPFDPAALASPVAVRAVMGVPPSPSQVSAAAAGPPFQYGPGVAAGGGSGGAVAVGGDPYGRSPLGSVDAQLLSGHGPMGGAVGPPPLAGEQPLYAAAGGYPPGPHPHGAPHPGADPAALQATAGMAYPQPPTPSMMQQQYEEQQYQLYLYQQQAAAAAAGAAAAAAQAQAEQQGVDPRRSPQAHPAPHGGHPSPLGGGGAYAPPPPDHVAFMGSPPAGPSPLPRHPYGSPLGGAHPHASPPGGPGASPQRPPLGGPPVATLTAAAAAAGAAAGASAPRDGPGGPVWAPAAAFTAAVTGAAAAAAGGGRLADALGGDDDSADSASELLYGPAGGGGRAAAAGGPPARAPPPAAPPAGAGANGGRRASDDWGGGGASDDWGGPPPSAARRPPAASGSAAAAVIRPVCSPTPPGIPDSLRSTASLRQGLPPPPPPAGGPPDPTADVRAQMARMALPPPHPPPPPGAAPPRAPPPAERGAVPPAATDGWGPAVAGVSQPPPPPLALAAGTSWPLDTLRPSPPPGRGATVPGRGGGGTPASPRTPLTPATPASASSTSTLGRGGGGGRSRESSAGGGGGGGGPRSREDSAAAADGRRRKRLLRRSSKRADAGGGGAPSGGGGGPTPRPPPTMTGGGRGATS
ncbi:hypothetical protein BU14_0118s0020 [Porphyra umbilicalis]|uniref:Uncharacterized protein n=1 Tax=Porphyra umbilicalis TaxID=2786 RepID=A0A1X6PB81_PORUM|nr:hypothetical protein BU14_0118s0020 [Porphyra umbilicalis]|eukprot:OSX78169.1 hypothetical protein BU14_0118s0020 [Porphyra umbilicalis]